MRSFHITCLFYCQMCLFKQTKQRLDTVGRLCGKARDMPKTFKMNLPHVYAS